MLRSFFFKQHLESDVPGKIKNGFLGYIWPKQELNLKFLFPTKTQNWLFIRSPYYTEFFLNYYFSKFKTCILRSNPTLPPPPQLHQHHSTTLSWSCETIIPVCPSGVLQTYRSSFIALPTFRLIFSRSHSWPTVFL